MKIILDVMGGDNAPEELVKGAVLAKADFPEVDLVLVGKQSEIEAVADKNKIDLSAFTVVNAEEIITMEDDPLAALKQKPDSSMGKALRLLAEGEGDAMVSTGNTGALFTSASLIVRKLPGVRRPAIGAVLPMDPPVLLLDSGANIRVEPEYFEHYAVMGNAYCKAFYGIESPRVGLLNNGAEEHKGTDVEIAAHKILTTTPGIRFVGNVEANRLVHDTCDVLVTDGFTGNVLLKMVEGMGEMMLGALKGIFLASLKTKIAALLCKKQLGVIKVKYNPNTYGGAPILGLRKPVIKAHGSSNAKAFRSAIRQAIRCAESDVTGEMSAAMQSLHEFRKEHPIDSADAPKE